MRSTSFNVGYAFILALSLALWLINQHVFLFCEKNVVLVRISKSNLTFLTDVRLAERKKLYTQKHYE